MLSSQHSLVIAHLNEQDLSYFFLSLSGSTMNSLCDVLYMHKNMQCLFATTPSIAPTTTIILTLLFDTLRLCTLDALVFGASIAGAVNCDSWEWIACQLNDLVFTRHLAAEFVCNHIENTKKKELLLLLKRFYFIHKWVFRAGSCSCRCLWFHSVIINCNRNQSDIPADCLLFDICVCVLKGHMCSDKEPLCI